MILGLDISSSSTGYGILDMEGKVVTYGQLRPTSNCESHGAKYSYISNKIKELLDTYKVTQIVLERYFISAPKGRPVNSGVFICAELRGVIKKDIFMEYPEMDIVEEIFPSTLKKTITGNGRAEKIEVARCILDKLGIQYTELKGKGSKCTFEIEGVKYFDDCSDALSLAYCHYIKGAS